MIHENLSTFDGKPVVDFDPATGIEDPGGTAYRIRGDHEDETGFNDRLAKFLGDPNVSQVRALVLGCWGYEGGDSAPIVEMLAAASGDLALEALFFGDIVSEECEVSWIAQSDISPLFLSFPELRILRVRGADGLQVGAIRHEKLEELAFETGGLPSRVWRQVVSAELPSLRRLEIWFGEDNYGFDGAPGDLAPLLDEGRFPELRYLGLMNSEIQDEFAAWIAAAPILARMETLDMSMGTLTDNGAAALAASEHFAKLRTFRMHHHYVSEEMVEKLRATGVEVDEADREEAEDDGDGEPYRYIAVSE